VAPDIGSKPESREGMMPTVDMKLEVVVIPVSDVDRATLRANDHETSESEEFSLGA
jgi:hypothetical protein